jgi:hypothetical protein
MSLAEDLKVLTPKIHPTQCSIGELFKHLSKEDVVLLKAVLANDQIRHSDICKTLRANGHSLTASTLARHRKQLCRCEA